MRARLPSAAYGVAVVGLCASIASLIDYLGSTATFCVEAGCNTVRESGWAHPLGIPMPALGVAFFVTAIVVGFGVASRAGWFRRALAIAGGGWAVLLIGLQAWVIHAWCKLCLIADGAAIGYALIVLAGAGTLQFTLRRAAVALPAVLATTGLVALWPHAEPAPTAEQPSTASSLFDPAPIPGTATVVEVVDFECPFCRRMQDRLVAAIAQAKHPVRVVRAMLPLQIHRHAMTAAIAYCCADAQGKGDAMAEALYAAEPDALTAEGCERLALGIGCDLERYRRERPNAEARVAAETATAEAAGVAALPTLVIGGERIVGASKSTEELVALLDAAATR